MADEVSQLTDRSTIPDQIVCHVDMDCFYAACERVRDPELRGEPVVIGMGYEPGTTDGAVATASYEAREYGVESAQPIATALEALPAEDGHYLPVDMDYYEAISEEIHAILAAAAGTVRKVSVDEAYLDVTDRTDWATVADYVQGIKDRIADDVGVIASVGVAPTMSAAKVASDHDKPDGLVVVTPGALTGFLADLDVAAIHDVGPETARELRAMGIETAGELAAADRSALADRFGERGRRIHRYARGADRRTVTPAEPPQSFLRASAIETTTDMARKRAVVSDLAADVAARAADAGALYRTVGIRVVSPPADVTRRSRSLPGHVDDPVVVEEIALELLAAFRDTPVRKLGVRLSNLTHAEQKQAGLGEWTDATNTDETAAPRHTDDTEPPDRGQRSLSDF
jgi:DNA polymerase IV (DinB-like DNA polymerase)